MYTEQHAGAAFFLAQTVAYQSCKVIIKSEPFPRFALY